MTIDYSNRVVVVTGGTGSLGAAVSQILLDAGAQIYIPAHRPPDRTGVPWLRHERVKVTSPVDLGDERAVESFYQSLPSLWASVHTVGGFTASGIDKTSLSDFQ